MTQFWCSLPFVALIALGFWLKWRMDHTVP